MWICQHGTDLAQSQDALRAVLAALERCDWASAIVPILHARVPILKFVALLKSDNTTEGGGKIHSVPVDLSFNYTGLGKSLALRQLARLQPRCGPTHAVGSSRSFRIDGRSRIGLRS